MKVEQTRLVFVLMICLTIGLLHADETSKRQQCRDFAGDRANCQRFIRCFYNLRVLFSCASATAYVPELQTCVARELVIDCDDSKNRDEIIVTSDDSQEDNDDYPTIEADLNALEAPMQKSLSHNTPFTITPRQFGCSSFCYNQGVCVLVGQKITCRCQTGFIGVRCQIAQAAISTRAGCIPNPCLNGGTCVDIVFSFTCSCLPGFVDDLCSTNDGSTLPATTATGPTGVACSINPCLNGAACVTSGGGFRCVCTPNYAGLLCEALVNTAVTATTATTATTAGCGVTNPCSNSGVCVPTTTGYLCQCSNSYTGSNCQSTSALSLRNQCQPSPCRNGGSCYLNQGGFACACPTGFNGTCCETSIAASNPCFNNPCDNSGTCQVVAAFTFRCVCPIGFLGIRCEQRICDPNPCLYGGVCLPLGNTFQCQCPPQYTGSCCELLIATTARPNPCSTQPCLNSGTCSATSATAFVCTCTPSYYGRCCEVRNYCQPNPCYNGGTCIATTNGYLCQCSYPNTGSNCEIPMSTPAPRPACPCLLCPCPTASVTVSNPCLPNPCQNNGGCAVVQNNAQCFCLSSFSGPNCQYQRKRTLTRSLCANITCLNGGECYAHETDPQCTCVKPYFGQHCELINRPRTCHPSPCGKHGQCVSTNNGYYQCVCDHGMTGILCEQMMMPKDYRWCPLDCRSGTSCVYEGSTPKCRVLSVY